MVVPLVNLVRLHKQEFTTQVVEVVIGEHQEVLDQQGVETEL